MSARPLQIDAFASEPFGGNPAAVCLLEAPADDAWMQNVAMEMNLSETAFVVPRDDGQFALRWFRPAREVRLCASTATGPNLTHATFAPRPRNPCVAIRARARFAVSERPATCLHKDRPIQTRAPFAPKATQALRGSSPRVQFPAPQIPTPPDP
jgi:hypothetical protein